MPKPLFNANETAVANLLDAIESVEGGILSKTLLDTDQVKQFLFSMDVGQELSEHSSPFAATIQVLDGALTATVGGRPHRLETHDWVVMPANVPHAIAVDRPVRFLLTMLKQPAVDRPNQP